MAFDLQAALNGMMQTPVRRPASTERLFAPLDRFGMTPTQQEPAQSPSPMRPPMISGVGPAAISGAMAPLLEPALRGTAAAMSFAPVGGTGIPPGPPSQEDYGSLADRIAQEHGVDTLLVRAVMQQESGGNARAVSPAGAQGLMQLMPPTAAQLGVQDPFDPEQNIRGGVRFLKWLLDKYGGDETMALAAYNAGPVAVDRYGGVPPFEETQRYVRSVRGMMGRP